MARFCRLSHAPAALIFVPTAVLAFCFEVALGREISKHNKLGFLHEGLTARTR